MPKYAYSTLRSEYRNRWERMIIPESSRNQIIPVARRLITAKARYKDVEARTRVPWYVIAVIHYRECGGRFTGHLHNGDPLTARTYHVPAGRPATGSPPFTWENSAVDALQLKGLHTVPNWPVETILYHLEPYNGYGYRAKGVPSPYLWAHTNQYVSGKYIRDHVYDPHHIDRQLGCAPLLKVMSELDNSIRLVFDGMPLGAPEKPAGKRSNSPVSDPSPPKKTNPGAPQGPTAGSAAAGGASSVLTGLLTNDWTLALAIGVVVSLVAFVIWRTTRKN